MDANLNRRVKLQRLTREQDPIGQPVERWVDVAEVWGSVIHKSGLATIKADSEVSIVRASIRIRYREHDVVAKMRAIVGGATYEIDAVLPDLESRQFLDLVCRRLA